MPAVYHGACIICRGARLFRDFNLLRDLLSASFKLTGGIVFSFGRTSSKLFGRAQEFILSCLDVFSLLGRMGVLRDFAQEFSRLS